MCKGGPCSFPLFLCVSHICVFNKRTNCLKVLGGFPGGSDGKESACHAEDPGLIPGSGRYPGDGNDDLLQDSFFFFSFFKNFLLFFYL